jgi:hypothetical protein
MVEYRGLYLQLGMICIRGYNNRRIDDGIGEAHQGLTYQQMYLFSKAERIFNVRKLPYKHFDNQKCTFG